MAITGKRYATKEEAETVADDLVSKGETPDAMAAYRPGAVALTSEPGTIKELRARQALEDNPEFESLEALKRYAQKNYDGHFTLFSFTTGYKVVFGTQMSGDYLKTREFFSSLPSSKTIAGACVNALTDPERFTATD